LLCDKVYCLIFTQIFFISIIGQNLMNGSISETQLFFDRVFNRSKTFKVQKLLKSFRRTVPKSDAKTDRTPLWSLIFRTHQTKPVYGKQSLYGPTLDSRGFQLVLRAHRMLTYKPFQTGHQRCTLRYQSHYFICTSRTLRTENSNDTLCDNSVLR